MARKLDDRERRARLQAFLNDLDEEGRDYLRELLAHPTPPGFDHEGHEAAWNEELERRMAAPDDEYRSWADVEALFTPEERAEAQRLVISDGV